MSMGWDKCTPQDTQPSLQTLLHLKWPFVIVHGPSMNGVDGETEKHHRGRPGLFREQH